MSSTLNPVCPLCGLRFASKPLLELHIREDHRPRRMRPGRADADGAGVLGGGRLPVRPARPGVRAGSRRSGGDRHDSCPPATRTGRDRPAPGAPRPPACERRADARVGSHNPFGPRTAVPPADPGARGQRHSSGYRGRTC